MVSFQTPLSPTPRKMIPEIENSTKKRKWEDLQEEEISEKKRSMESIFDNTELNLKAPLPLDWQRYLDITSGQIYFYNTRTHKKISRDPRTSPEPPSSGSMSLDLELNLPCGSAGKNHVGDNFTNHNSNSNSGDDQIVNSSRNNKNPAGLTRTPSWLTVEGDQQEMVTAVCKKCHMLVMMLKASPACPNCKFMHPPDQSPPSLFNQRLSLLC